MPYIIIISIYTRRAGAKHCNSPKSAMQVVRGPYDYARIKEWSEYDWPVYLSQLGEINPDTASFIDIVKLDHCCMPNHATYNENHL